MHRILVPALLLALTGFAYVASASPVVKPITKSDVVRAAEARIVASKIPTIPTFAQPKSRDLAKLFPNWRLTREEPSSEPAPSPAPALTPEELAVNVVEIVPERLQSPQVGIMADAQVTTFDLGPNNNLQIKREIGLEPAKHHSLTFFPVASWIEGRSLLVECTGTFKEPTRVSFAKFSDAQAYGLWYGQLLISSGPTNQRAFLVPATPLDGFDHLVVRIEDADYKGSRTIFDRCTLTRL